MTIREDFEAWLGSVYTESALNQLLGYSARDNDSIQLAYRAFQAGYMCAATDANDNTRQS